MFVFDPTRYITKLKYTKASIYAIIKIEFMFYYSIRSKCL